MSTPYKYIKRITVLSLLLTLTIVVRAQQAFTDSLREGDLLFVCSKVDNAITKVTKGVNGNTIDHVGIVIQQNGKWDVLEAIHKGVVLTPLQEFIFKNTPHHCCPPILHGRITGDIDFPTSIKNALGYLGKPYDFYFMPDDKQIYCSELVQKSFVDHHGHLIFQPIPMSFHDRKGHILDYWRKYYGQKGMTVPEGKPGSNPGELSRNSRVKIF
jgi:hypothetical protein